MNPSFNDIVYFIEVAERKNISRAAERLGITQPSLSSAIRRLEDCTGTELLIRSRTGVELTRSGKEMLHHGRLLLQDWEQLKTNIVKRDSQVSGQYVIGCHPSVALYMLSEFLPHLLSEYPQLEIRLVHDLSRKITERVISSEVDFGIVVNPVKHPDLVIRELCQDQVQFWTAKKPSANQDPYSGGAVLICDGNLLQSQKLMADLQKKKIAFSRTIFSSNLEVITDLTAAGAGVGIIPARVAQRISPGKLKPLGEDLPVFKDRICLAYRADHQRSQAAKMMIETIKQKIDRLREKELFVDSVKKGLSDADSGMVMTTKEVQSHFKKRRKNKTGK